MPKLLDDFKKDFPDTWQAYEKLKGRLRPGGTAGYQDGGVDQDRYFHRNGAPGWGVRSRLTGPKGGRND